MEPAPKKIKLEEAVDAVVDEPVYVPTPLPITLLAPVPIPQGEAQNTSAVIKTEAPPGPTPGPTTTNPTTATATVAATAPPPSSAPPSTASPASAPPSTTSPLETTDVAASLNLAPGSRLVVMWDLVTDAEPDFAVSSKGSKSALPEQQVTETWWGATLLPADGRSYSLRDDETGEVGVVPLRVLDYDANDAMGYPERTQSECVFVGEHLIFDTALQMTSIFKREGDAWLPSDVDLNEGVGEGAEGVAPAAAAAAAYGDINPASVITIGSSRGDYETFFDTMFASAFAKITQATAMYSFTSAVKQRAVAEIFGQARTELIESLWKNTQGVEIVTQEHIQTIIQEVGQKLTDIKREVFASTDMTDTSRN